MCGILEDFAERHGGKREFVDVKGLVFALYEVEDNHAHCEFLGGGEGLGVRVDVRSEEEEGEVN